MKAAAMAPYWIFMAAIAFPLVLISIAAIGSRLYASTVDTQENNDPVVFRTNPVWLGSLTITTNVRLWAGMSVILGLAITSIGLVGLLHFPTSAPVINTEYYMPSEPRLFGTWISDKERTQERFSEHMTETQKDKLSSLFGKLRVTFSNSTYTTELDGHIETIPYTVLGVDKHSVVIRDDSVQNPDLDVLEMSTFSKIHFDGSDAYWVITEIGGLTEYFRRVHPDGKRPLPNADEPLREPEPSSELD